MQFFPQRSMPSRYCEFASGDDQAVPCAVGMYKEHGGKYIQFSFLVIPRHANFSQNRKSILLIKSKKGRIRCEGGGNYELESVKLFYAWEVKGTYALGRYHEFHISGVIKRQKGNKFSCPLERTKSWGKEEIGGIQIESFTYRYCMHTELCSVFFNFTWLWIFVLLICIKKTFSQYWTS